ncbi:MAG: B12-binding domain-containing radical SAM protein [Bryobacteraceae bacterium]|nr:B12-binding domain-containing radical SAM protein [Bryobacteraceae bacterium]
METSKTGGVGEGKPIVLTAPLSEIVEHAGYFIQMALASLPKRLERIIHQKYPRWRELERNEDGSARVMPAGVRVLEAALLRHFPADDVVACYPDDLPRFVGPRTRVVAVSTHNPLGVTFAAGIYASIFGSSRDPINSYYARELFAALKSHPCRSQFQVIVGGSGGWQVAQTGSYEELGVDCVVEGRGEAADTVELFRKALRGEKLPRFVEVRHPAGRDGILTPAKRTTFGVVEMTTGCGRRCQFCLPDLNPQLDVPKERILAAVRAIVEDGGSQVSLATEDMFIWGQVHTGVPFYFPNREALLDLYQEIVSTPGVRHHVLSHATMAPAVVDPVLIERLSAILLDKSPLRLPKVSTHPEGKILSPLIGLETASVRLAKQIMPGKAAPFPIEEWPSVFIQGLTVLNRNNWFPVVTLMIGNPGETDDDVRATLDLIYEVERRNLFALFIPSIFTPLHDTRMQDRKGVVESRELSPLQWQLMMKCWKMNLERALQSWWGPWAWRTGALLFWLTKLRKANGPNFTWPLMMFAGVLPESVLAKMGKIYRGKPLRIKSRKELLATIKPQHWKYLRADTGDLPDGYSAWAGESNPSDLVVLSPGPVGAAKS